MSIEKIGDKMALSAEQIAEMDNLQADKRAEKATLKIAMQRHANALSHIDLLLREIWERYATNLGVDLKDDNIRLKCTQENGVVVVKVISKEEDEADRLKASMAAMG